MSKVLGPAPDLTGRRILVVEDEYFIADDIARALTSLGAEVIGPAADLQRAKALLSEGSIDWAVLDINLQGEMVYPLAQALQERSIPFIFATGYDRTSIPNGYADVPRWEKPFDPQTLARVLPSLMKSSASRVEAKGIHPR